MNRILSGIMFISQFVFNGLITGAILSLVAIGFSLIYATNRFVHFAHGVVLAFGAHMLYVFFSLFGFPFVAAVFLTLVLSSFLGILVNALVYVPLRKRKASNAILLIASLALMILIENILLGVFGPGVKSIGFLTAQKGMSIAGAMVTPLQVLIMVSSLILLFIVWFFVKYTKSGRYIRAVSDHPELAMISGVPVHKIRMLGFAVGSLIAGLASVFVALEQNVSPFMGTNLIVKGFAGAVVGGMYSLPGAVLGSFLLGLGEHLGTMFLPSEYKEAISFTILFIFLLFRPQGILGIKKKF